MNTLFNNLNTPILLLIYIILASLVVTSSIYLSKYVDALDKKTNLSGAFIGGVILAAITSLPELFTSLTAVTILDQPELVQGNVYGSNIFNLTIISVCVFISLKTFKDTNISKTHTGTLVFTILMFILSLVGIYLPEKYTISIAILKVNIVSILIILLYIMNLRIVKNDTISTDDEGNNLPLTVQQIIIRFTLFSILLVALSIVLTNVSDTLSDKLKLGKTVAGAIFLGIATSLPELTSSINLVRLKNFNAAVGNITGSNLFNFTILCFGDLLYKGGSIYNSYKGNLTNFSEITNANIGSIIIIIFALISSILSILILKYRKSTLISILLAMAIIVSYTASIAYSM